jgi:hypothetical protein
MPPAGKQVAFFFSVLLLAVKRLSETDPWYRAKK